MSEIMQEVSEGGKEEKVRELLPSAPGKLAPWKATLGEAWGAQDPANRVTYRLGQTHIHTSSVNAV